MKTMSAAGKGPSAAINDPVYNGSLDTSKEGSTGRSYMDGTPGRQSKMHGSVTERATHFPLVTSSRVT